MRSLAFLLALLLVSGTTLTAATLYFTLPSRNASAPGACDDGGEPLVDLSIVRLYGAGQGDTVSLLAEHAAGEPGGRDSFGLTPDARPWTYWVRTVDLVGNESCNSPPIQLGGAAAVDLYPLGEGVKWWDVLGRRVHGKPVTPGVYWWRQGTRRGRTVILR